MSIFVKNCLIIKLQSFTPSKLARMGQEWIKKNSDVALVVPSSVTPQAEGRNYILNPRHSDFYQIKVVGVTEYRYDSRFFSQG